MIPGGPSPAEKASIWAIGDLQGCLPSLERLLEAIPADARLWLTGDLINRGPQSLETLRWVRAQGSRIVTVLGNHDLHLLAVAAGVRRPHRSDTLQSILEAPDRDALIDWVRSRPLAHYDHEAGWLLVHAGVLPQWDRALALSCAAEVETVLRGSDWTSFLQVMYGDTPARWSEGLQGADRLRVIVNALTRLRFCSPQGDMEFKTKEGAQAAPSGFKPWFEIPGRASEGQPVVFGHWSTLGLINRPDLLALDTGCVWGGQLTAVRLSDRSVRQVRCPG